MYFSNEVIDKLKGFLNLELRKVEKYLLEIDISLQNLRKKE
jgi:hypothetical protein